MTLCIPFYQNQFFLILVMICRNDDHGVDEDDKDENSFRLSILEAKKLIMITMTIAMVVMKNLMMTKKFF